jgi:hypothetical protein
MEGHVECREKWKCVRHLTRKSKGKRLVGKTRGERGIKLNVKAKAVPQHTYGGAGGEEV